GLSALVAHRRRRSGLKTRAPAVSRRALARRALPHPSFAAESFELSVHRGSVLVQSREELLRDLGILRASRRDVQLRDEEVILRILRQIAALRGLVLAHREVAHEERRHALQELRVRARRDAVGELERRDRRLVVPGLLRRRRLGRLELLIAKHEEE